MKDVYDIASTPPPLLSTDSMEIWVEYDVLLEPTKVQSIDVCMVIVPFILVR